MILVEADNDLADCVTAYFHGRFDVTRLTSLSEVPGALEEQEATLLFADFESACPDQLSVLEGLRRSHPELKIVVTYLAPFAMGAWRERLRESAHVLVRKPYSILHVDRALRSLDEKNGNSSN